MEWPSKESQDLRLITATHKAADDVMTNQRALIEVDKRRQNVRQALRELESPSNANVEQTTLMTGLVMISLPKEQVKTILKKDLSELNIESNRLRSQLKEDVNLLRELEMKNPVRGFDLQALSGSEMAAVNQVLGFSNH